MIRGDEQIEGFNYNETFAPIVKMTNMRRFLAVIVAKGWHLHQMDVTNAFLLGDLNEEPYMAMPPFFHTSNPNKACQLRKSLYGLRQTPR